MTEPNAFCSDEYLDKLYEELVPAVNIAGKPSRIDGISPQESRIRFKHQTSYINHTGQPIAVGLANGMVVPIPATSHSVCRDFIIRTKYTIDASIREEIRNYFLNYEADDSDREFHTLRDEFMEQYRKRTGWMEIEIDYVVSVEELTVHGGALFVSDANVTVTLLAKKAVNYHPFSRHETKKNRFDPNRIMGGIAAEVIDNTGRIGDRYLTLMPGVVTVAKANKSHIAEEGLYIKEYGTYDELSREMVDNTQYFPIEEIDKLTFVYRSYTDAKNSPGVEKLNALNLAKEKLGLEAENLRLSKELETLKLMHDRARLTEGGREAEISHAREIERLALKDVYERRSMDRKESESWLKGFTGVAVAVVGVVTLAVKAISWVSSPAKFLGGLLSFL